MRKGLRKFLKPSREGDVFRINADAIANPVARGTVRLARGLLERTLCFGELNDLYEAADRLDHSDSFSTRVLRSMNVTWRIASGGDIPVPAEGPLVVVANHPFGGIEGMLLTSIMEKFRPDSRVMVNYLLAMIPDVRERFIFVDPFGAPGSASANIKPIKECLAWLRGGGALGIFPAGEVSSVDLKSGKVRDPAWSPMVAGLVRKTRATVLPMFFAGHNGPLFNLAGLIHPRLRTLMLPQQFVNKNGRELTVHIGRPIPWSEMEEYAEDRDLIQYLRLRTYILAEREPAKRKRIAIPLRPKRTASTACATPVDPPQPPEAVAAEVAALPADHLLISMGDIDVYFAEADRIPSVLKELGRLREETFRAVGEGTGTACDLDRFDGYYLHLFLWNREKSEIAGAYRLGLADEICAAHGPGGLYTHTLFRFDERLLSHIQPAIELGRSFVRLEYQKAYSPLLLLWKGIGAFVATHPRYTHLFGPVSITNEYRDSSRNLMLRSLRLSNFEGELARLVRPRRPPRKPARAEWNLPDFNPYIDNIDLVSKLVQEIEGDGRKGIPILLKQYLKLGGRLLAFNVDPDFSSVVDGLISVDLRHCDPRILARYMGESESSSFLAAHSGE